MKKLIKRSERLSFMDVGSAEEPSYARMTKFTSIKGSKNPIDIQKHQYMRNFQRLQMKNCLEQIHMSIS